MKYSNELQNIDNTNNAYLLGLFYADGNISKNQHHTKLYLKDKDLIYKLKEIYPFFNVYKMNNLLGIQSGIKKVREDFILNGCLPDKSFSNKTVMRLPFINNLTFDFIRGYFDGDGGCTLTFSNKKVQKRVYLYSASFNFLNDISNFLINNSIKNTITKCDTIYKLSIDTISYQTFYESLYKKDSLFLKRKREKYDEILKTNFFIQKEAPICINCNSNNTVFNGNYFYNKVKNPRILCKDCKNNFIIKTAPYSSNIISGGDELLEN